MTFLRLEVAASMFRIGMSYQILHTIQCSYWAMPNGMQVLPLVHVRENFRPLFCRAARTVALVCTNS